MAQVVECTHSKHQVLSSITSTAKTKQKEKKKKKEQNINICVHESNGRNLSV
jgi:hypothetical protein